jgi:hypothetical protein
MLQFEYGYGLYSMKGLKEFNKGLVSNAPISSLIVADFPSEWYYRPSLMLKYKIVNLGVIYTYQATSAEISGKNDTAQYLVNFDASSHCPGFYGELSIYYIGNFTLMADASLGFIFSDLRFDEYFKMSDSVHSDKRLNYKGTSYFAEPGLQIKYSYKHFDFGLNAGYFFSIAPDAYYIDEVYRDELTNPFTNSTIKPEWSGFRLGVSVSYFIYRKTLVTPTRRPNKFR